MTFTESIDIFLAKADWLSDDDLPAVVALRAMAAELDAQINPPLVAQFGLTYRNLLKRKPEVVEELDELARLLKR